MQCDNINTNGYNLFLLSSYSVKVTFGNVKSLKQLQNSKKVMQKNKKIMVDYFPKWKTSIHPVLTTLKHFEIHVKYKFSK